MTTDLLCDMVPTGQGREHRCTRCGQRVTPGGDGPVRIRASCLATLRDGSPSLAQRAWNLGSALTSFVADGLHTVDRDTYAARLAACDRCDRRRDEHCQECGCRIALKAYARAWDCPLERWPGGANYLPPLAADRMAVCRTCDQLRDGVCTLAGMEAKAAVLRPEATCPRRVWPGDGGHQPVVVSRGDDRRLLLVFPHGFGDHVQLTTLLLHLQRHRPDWIVDVVCRPGAASLYRGLCRRALPWSLPRDEPYDQTVTLPWFEPRETYPDSPSTKAEKCLREVFGIQPDEDLCRYEIRPTTEDFEAARAYLGRICSPDSDGRFPVVLLHYQGRSGEKIKSIPSAVAPAIVDRIRDRGLIPTCLDWDAKCPLVAAGRVGAGCGWLRSCRHNRWKSSCLKWKGDRLGVVDWRTIGGENSRGKVPNVVTRSTAWWTGVQSVASSRAEKSRMLWRAAAPLVMCELDGDDCRSGQCLVSPIPVSL